LQRKRTIEVQTLAERIEAELASGRVDDADLSDEQVEKVAAVLAPPPPVELPPPPEVSPPVEASLSFELSLPVELSSVARGAARRVRRTVCRVTAAPAIVALAEWMPRADDGIRCSVLAS